MNHPVSQALNNPKPSLQNPGLPSLEDGFHSSSSAAVCRALLMLVNTLKELATDREEVFGKEIDSKQIAVEATQKDTIEAGKEQSAQQLAGGISGIIGAAGGLGMAGFHGLRSKGASDQMETLNNISTEEPTTTSLQDGNQESNPLHEDQKEFNTIKEMVQGNTPIKLTEAQKDTVSRLETGQREALKTLINKRVESLQRERQFNDNMMQQGTLISSGSSGLGQTVGAGHTKQAAQDNAQLAGHQAATDMLSKAADSNSKSIEDAYNSVQALLQQIATTEQANALR